MLLDNGSYAAVCKGVSPYYRGNGRLSVAVKCDVEGVEILARIHVELNDGTISDGSLKRLREVFPAWDGTIDGLFLENAFAEVSCNIEVENTTDEKGKTWSEVKWLNPPGGHKALTMPEQADRKDLAAKYGSRFRALAGPAPLKSATPPPTTTPAKKKTPAPAKAPTMEECWEALNNREPDSEKATAEWTRIIDAHVKGKEYDQITGPEWLMVMAACKQKADDLPY